MCNIQHKDSTTFNADFKNLSWTRKVAGGIWVGKFGAHNDIPKPSDWEIIFAIGRNQYVVIDVDMKKGL